MDREPQNIKPIIKDSPQPVVDAVLFIKRWKDSLGRFIKDHPDSKDFEVVSIVMALFSKQHFISTNEMLNTELAKLTSESESLIGSPDANTPEVKARRKVLADQIDILLQQQIKLQKEGANLEHLEAVIRSAPADKLARAKALIEPVIKELELINNPPVVQN